MEIFDLTDMAQDMSDIGVCLIKLAGGIQQRTETIADKGVSTESIERIEKFLNSTSGLLKSMAQRCQLKIAKQHNQPCEGQ
jgi:hypothetical protein